MHQLLQLEKYYCICLNIFFKYLKFKIYQIKNKLKIKECIKNTIMNSGLRTLEEATESSAGRGISVLGYIKQLYLYTVHNKIYIFILKTMNLNATYEQSFHKE